MTRINMTHIHEPHRTTRESMMARLSEMETRWLGCRANHQKDSHKAVFHFIEQCCQLLITDSLSIEQRHIDCYKLGLENRGLSASTINTRLVAVKAYVDYLVEYTHRNGWDFASSALAGLKFSYKTRTKQAKWHMTDQQVNMIPGILETMTLQEQIGHEEAKLVQGYIAWTFETGLRVEETLRLQWADFEGIGSDRPALNVPGTKNEQAAVRIPISLMAAAIISQRYTVIAASRAGRGARLFDISYERLGRTIWNRIREALCVQDDPTSTLKALRRNFALNALRKGLPARIIQELMRHSNIETTMGYLRLMGMSDNDETRALLNRTLNQQPLPGPQVTKSDSLDLFESQALIEALRARGLKVTLS